RDRRRAARGHRPLAPLGARQPRDPRAARVGDRAPGGFLERRLRGGSGVTPGSTWDPVAFWARWRPDAVALRMGDEVWSYARLEVAVIEAAVSFYDQGLVSGEHVSMEFGAEQGRHF